MLRALVLLAVVVAATQAASVVKRQVPSGAGYIYSPVSYGNPYYYLLCRISPTYCILPTQASSTTTTTATPTTTTPPVKLCPPRQAVNSRLLGADVLAECKGNGLIGFESVFNGTRVAACNGVVAPDPVNTTSYIIYTDPTCLELLKFVRDDPEFSVDGTVYGTTISNVDVALNLDKAVTTNNVTVVKPTILGQYFFANAQSPCKSAACVYNATAMASYIKNTTCYVASYGITKLKGVASPGGNRVDIMAGGTCVNATAGSECFTALRNFQVSCVGDIGAPVYCATTTGEEVLYGILPYSRECDLDNKTFSVMPIKM